MYEAAKKWNHPILARHLDSLTLEMFSLEVNPRGYGSALTAWLNRSVGSSWQHVSIQPDERVMRMRFRNLELYQLLSISISDQLWELSKREDGTIRTHEPPPPRVE